MLPPVEGVLVVQLPGPVTRPLLSASLADQANLLLAPMEPDSPFPPASLLPLLPLPALHCPSNREGRVQIPDTLQCAVHCNAGR